jgi:hypothetical protein
MVKHYYFLFARFWSRILSNYPGKGQSSFGFLFICMVTAWKGSLRSDMITSTVWELGSIGICHKPALQWEPKQLAGSAVRVQKAALGWPDGNSKVRTWGFLIGQWYSNFWLWPTVRPWDELCGPQPIFLLKKYSTSDMADVEDCFCIWICKSILPSILHSFLPPFLSFLFISSLT